MLNKKVIIDSLRNLSKPTKMTNKNSFDFKKGGSKKEGFISAQEGVETPIYKAVKVGASPIEGKGLFADQAIRKGDVIGVSHIRKKFMKDGDEYQAPFPSTVLGYYNHSEEPNVYEVDNGDHIVMVAGRDIQRGQELTSNYNKHNIEDLEVPEDFKKGGATKRPSLPSKKSPRSYSRSFEATNRLFAQHPLFKKPKSRKNKIFDPNSEYYDKGGEPPYNNLPPTYLTALQNFIYPNVKDDPERTGYNSINNTINYDSQSPIENMDNKWWMEHELFHDLQNQAGGMSTLGIVGQRPNPYVASDESMQGYYDRRNADLERSIDSMIAQNPDLQFIPRNKLAEGAGPGFIGAEDLQYADPSTLEGEARQYEQYIKEGNPSIFPNRKYGGLIQYAPGGASADPPDWFTKKGANLYFNPAYQNNFTGSTNRFDSYTDGFPIYKVNPSAVLGIEGSLSKGRDASKEAGRGWTYNAYAGLPYDSFKKKNFTPSAGVMFDYENSPQDKAFRPQAQFAAEYNPTDGFSISGTSGARFALTPYGNKRVKPGYGVGHLDIYGGGRFGLIDRQNTSAGMIYGARVHGKYMPRWLNKLSKGSYFYGDAGLQFDPVKGKGSQKETDLSLPGAVDYSGQQLYTSGKEQDPGTKWGATAYANVGIKKEIDDIKFSKDKRAKKIQEIEDEEKRAEQENYRKEEPVIEKPKKACPEGQERYCEDCPCEPIERVSHPRWLQYGGGIDLDLADEDIQKYVDGGYIVEELPKASRGREKKTYVAPKLNEVQFKPVEIQTYNPKLNEYQIHKAELPDRIVPGREYADVKHKMGNLRKDLGISGFEHLMSKYIPGAAHPISLVKDSGIVIDPATGKLLDSNTRYWLNREYGFEPSIDQFFQQMSGTLAKDYGKLIMSSDTPFQNRKMGINYMDEFASPYTQKNGLLNLFGEPTGGGSLMIGMGMMGKPEFTKEIKNPDYFNQLLDSYTTKQLSSSSKKFYKDLINSVKNQNGLVTERQYNELQRLKTGNFDFGKKGYADGGLVKAARGLPVKNAKNLGRRANIATVGTANTLAKTFAPVMMNPARIPMFGARVENMGPFTGSPLNALPFYGKKIMPESNTAFRKFGDSLDYVKLSGELNPVHGPLIRMGKDQIASEGNWAALNQPNEWYPGVMAAKFDFNAPGTNLGFTKIPQRDGVLITDAQGNRMPAIPISDPGLSFQRRLPFSNRYVDVNMNKLRNDQFDISTVGTNTQALLERYGYGMGYAALLGAMGLSAPQEIIDDYINKPLIEGFNKTRDFLQPLDDKAKELLIDPFIKEEGGEIDYELGQEVDEETKRKLEALGYTFEIVK